MYCLLQESVMNSLRLVLSASALVVLVTAAAGGAVAAVDPYPNACVDCHVVQKDKGTDHRLSVGLKNWTAGKIDARLLAKSKASAPTGIALKGKHPAVEESLEDIPAACFDCHGSDSKKAPPLGRLMHLVHLTGGANNTFVSSFKSDCMHCHKLDSKTGEWSLPSGPEKK
jgi:cytochrome c553